MGRRADTLAYAPMGLSREEAARYVGVGLTKFDEMVSDGRMPRPKRIDGRKIWVRVAVEAAISDLPDDGETGNSLDALFQRHRGAA